MRLGRARFGEDGFSNHSFSSRAQEPLVTDGWKHIGMRLSELRCDQSGISVLGSIIMRSQLAAIFFLVVAAAAGVSPGQGPPPDYGLTWRTIGDPGNAAAQPRDYFWLQQWGLGPVGQVNYSYRMAQTELTVGQWVQFVDAYSRANPNVNINDWGFTGWNIYYTSADGPDHGWYAAPGTQDFAVVVGWFYAARYVNWLQNNKAMTLSAFEDGVYNLSTFHQLPNGTWEGDPTREPGARFWLPSLDEWDKAMHWDPNKNGPGQGGYWLYPTSSDTPPVSGLPGAPGAQTSAGYNPSGPLEVPVGSYPNVQSPWGLLDGSGGACEWLDLWGQIPALRGSATQQNIDPFDRLDYFAGDSPNIARGGIRIASAVPSPGFVIWAAVAVPLLRRRRRCDESA
jgi:hypothetical protein